MVSLSKPQSGSLATAAVHCAYTKQRLLFLASRSQHWLNQPSTEQKRKHIVMFSLSAIIAPEAICPMALLEQEAASGADTCTA